MSREWQRTVFAVVWACYSALLVFVSAGGPGGEDVGLVAVVGLVFGAIIDFWLWPVFDFAMGQGATFRPSPRRVFGALAAGGLFALGMSLLWALLLDHDDLGRSLLIGLLIGVVMAYLAWPKIEGEIARRRR